MSVGLRRWLSIAAACALLSSTGSLAACSRNAADTKTEGGASQSLSQPESQPQSVPKPKSNVAGADGKLPTLQDYIKQSGITETEVKPDDPNVPTFKFPVMPGWRDAGKSTPSYAYAAVVDSDPALQPDPPSMVVLLSRLTDADPQEILALAANEPRNLPEFDGGEPEASKLSGFDSVTIAGRYVRDGQTRLIVQRTIVVPGKDGLYVMQINGDSPKGDNDDRALALTAAFNAIEQRGTITP